MAANSAETAGPRAEDDHESTSPCPGRREENSMEQPQTGQTGWSSPYSQDVQHSNRGWKRQSFFGSSLPDTSAARRLPLASTSTLHIHPLQDAFEERPTLSSARTGGGRKRAETLNSIRNSLFGGRRKASFVENDVVCFRSESRPSSRNGLTVSPRDDLFTSEEEFYHHQRKMSISHPFNFQHITHTPRKHLPRLQAVDEKDLAAEFWSLSSNSMSRRQQHRLRVEEMREKIHREMGIPKLPPPSRPASTPLGPPPTERPGTRSTMAAPEMPSIDMITSTAYRDDASISTSESTHRSPRQYSSMVAMNVNWPSPPKTTRPPSRPAPSPQLDLDRDLAVVSIQPDLHENTLPDQTYRARQPLPPLPMPNGRLSKSSSTTSLVSAHDADDWESSYIRSYTRNNRAPNFPSRPIPRRGHLSRLSEEHRRSVVEEPSWEDAVDFMYENAAESTCDFDWTIVDPSQQSMQTALSNSSKESFHVVEMHSVPSHSRPSISLSTSHMDEARASPSSDRSRIDHRRGSSVGHRGFLAARNGGTTPSTPNIEMTAAEFEAGLISSPTRTHFGADAIDKKPSLTALQPPPRVDSANSGFVAELEAMHIGTSRRHRKSNSTGSVRKSFEIFSEDDIPASMASSTTSLPHSLHSHKRSKSANKIKLSEPLETLPQSPPETGPAPMSPTRAAPTISELASPSPMLPEEGEDVFMMRRPQTRGDRAVLQAAGRAVQRGRPSTPHRFSRLFDLQHTTQPQPAWI